MGVSCPLKMGTSTEAAVTDKLGRRSGPRRTYTIAEKRSMVEETQVHGASVPRWRSGMV